MRRATRLAPSGRQARIRRSASRRDRLTSAWLVISSNDRPGAISHNSSMCSPRNTQSVSSAEILTVPVAASGRDGAWRSTASAATAISATRGIKRSPAGVGARPVGRRSNRRAPTASSSARSRRDSLGWLKPSFLAAADRLRVEATASRIFRSSQFIGAWFPCHTHTFLHNRYPDLPSPARPWQA